VDYEEITNFALNSGVPRDAHLVVRVDNLTIMGMGRDSVIIGPIIPAIAQNDPVELLVAENVAYAGIGLLESGTVVTITDNTLRNNGWHLDISNYATVDAHQNRLLDCTLYGIWDNNDGITLRALIDFEPFAGEPVPADGTSLGAPSEVQRTLARATACAGSCALPRPVF